MLDGLAIFHDNIVNANGEDYLAEIQEPLLIRADLLHVYRVRIDVGHVFVTGQDFSLWSFEPKQQ